MILKVTKTNKISGDIYISGSKNAALPCICGNLLTKQRVILTNIPDIEDVNNLLLILQKIGVKVRRKNDQVIIYAKYIKITKKARIICQRFLFFVDKRKEYVYLKAHFKKLSELSKRNLRAFARYKYHLRRKRAR